MCGKHFLLWMRKNGRREKISSGLSELSQFAPLRKNKMATFESYFLEEKETHKEKKNPYYSFLDQEEVMDRILAEFGLGTDAHIVNGHVPVLQSSGESPVKCGGKVLVIDGGFSKAYQAKTGIAGYTLIYNSYGMMLVAHMPFYLYQRGYCQ